MILVATISATEAPMSAAKELSFSQIFTQP